MPEQCLIPAAQYLRMSTDHQKLSFAYQAAAIDRYASKHGFVVSKTYEDSGKSGLTLKRRRGLTQLLQDVVSGENEFKAVLVYDVSRWGRFQDTDESAHYEFLCRSAGVPVHYCAEPFKNSTSSPAIVMKTLKRVMAAEYSRELSQRMRRCKVIMTKQGFRAGGNAGYGLRRLLVSNDGSPKQVLARGEVKGIASGRVILVPGPAREVAHVKEIYCLTVNEAKSAKAIARDFNSRGIKCLGARWNDQRILDILRNPKYAGWAVWGRTTGPLGKKRVDVPHTHWTINAHAFEPIIDQETFDRAQAVLSSRTRYMSSDEMLTGLRLLLKREGKLSQYLIENSREVPGSCTYARRFGGLRQAYALIGYREFANHDGARHMRSRHWKLYNSLLSRICRIFGSDISLLRERPGCRRVLCFRDGLKVSVVIAQYVNYANRVRWGIKVNPFDRDYPALICRCSSSNSSFLDFYLVPKIDSQCSDRFLVSENDPWLKAGKRLHDLSRLWTLAQKAVSTLRNRTMAVTVDRS